MIITDTVDQATRRKIEKALQPFEQDELMAECPLVGYPTGWFIAAFSHEVPVGKVLPVHYFGDDLVVWRGESGKAVVMDAHCPHMGCHLATGAVGHPLEHGGTVGDTIQCPFHGWRFDTDGLNVEIPYSKHLNKVRARVWPTREIYGRWILVWHDMLGREPMWEPRPVPELEQPDKWFLGEGEVGYNVWEEARSPGPVGDENAVDAGHAFFVHGFEARNSNILESEGAFWVSEFDTTFRNRKGEFVGEGHINMEHWGLGFKVHRIDGGARKTIQIFGGTPTHGWNGVLRGMAFVAREHGEQKPPPIVKVITTRQLHTADEDKGIFSRMRYVRKPPYAPEERNMRKMRRWIDSFYPVTREVA
jgi:phenylpropionate dioxygenase-like ring-hydroxylating dioxygenase large terminal subunit